MSVKNSIKVAIKIRPLPKKESSPIVWRFANNSIQLADSTTDPYSFDHIFDQDVTNQIIFDEMAKPIVHSAIEGFNGTIFAYGQTSSGKTYTMMGDNDNPGVMVLAAKEIFTQIKKSKDRRFLLRVGYIEIYNEKIFDLLNKKNQDLKIHDTASGSVSINCEEIIIQCEDDLLMYLNKGSKERTVGETNMNERSSRSHAIFRIIIESQKMEHTEDESVIQSVINLVDLAGSERADQTGARGTRLKEGGHINKSLLFLSNVIKRLSENEDATGYISYRDSKLTRILQASLGGNALTAIICTIKPNTVEETQSTLNFALRAKAIKNKPQVNEIVSEATMMKRLEKEIKQLKIKLEEEQRRNASKLKVQQLQQRIQNEDLKIISCQSLRRRENRRRTWCPSSTNVEASEINVHSSVLHLPHLDSISSSGIPQPSRLPARKAFDVQLITLRATTEYADTSNGCFLPIHAEDMQEIDEEFRPSELVNFERSPIKTPENESLAHHSSITPKLIANPQSALKKVEDDLEELRRFTNLENELEVEHEPIAILKQQVKTLSEHNSKFQEERLEYLRIKQEFEVTCENLSEAQMKIESLMQRIAELEEPQLKDVYQKATETLITTNERCAALQEQVAKYEISNKIANDQIAKYELELVELKKINDNLQMENREAVNLEFEFKRHQNKSKLRERELLELLSDKSSEITKLQKSLNLINETRLKNAKQELLQRSLNKDGEADEDNNLSIKCGDLQSLLNENKAITSDFEKLTLEYEQLKLNYLESERESRINREKIGDLEQVKNGEKDECEKLLLEVDQLRKKLNKVQHDYDLLGQAKREECMQLNMNIEKAREEMVVLEEKFKHLELSWQEQQKTILNIEAEYSAIQTKYKQLQTQYEQVETSRSDTIISYQGLEKDNLDLQIEIKDLKKKVHEAQQSLLESCTKYEEAARDIKSEKEEYASETFKLRQENEEIKKQLLQIEIKQEEYDILSNQLIDNIQENDNLRDENIKLKEQLKVYAEKNENVANAEVEINALKSQLENVLAKTSYFSCGYNSSMRNSGECIDLVETQELIKKFYQLLESLTEIEIQHTSGKTKLFKSVCKNSARKSCRMHLINFLDIHKNQNECEYIKNIHLQGFFNHYFFVISELRDENEICEKKGNFNINCCEDIEEYIEKPKEEIVQLKTINQSLFESTERDLSEMKEQIIQLQSELLEKSTFVENCTCTTYKQRIINLENDNDNLTTLVAKVNSILNSSLQMNTTTREVADIKFSTEHIIRDLEQLKRREQELLQSYDSQERRLQEMESDLKNAQEKIKNQQNDFVEKCNELQLENLQKLELSANEYRENMNEHNNEWECRKDQYEPTIRDLENLEMQRKKETTFLTDDTAVIQNDMTEFEQDKYGLEELNANKELLEKLKEENRTQLLEIDILLNKITNLEMLLEEARLLQGTANKENSSLKTQIDSIKGDQVILLEQNQQLSKEIENLKKAYTELEEKLQKAETQIQESSQADKAREALIETLETKVSGVAILETEKKNIEVMFENLKQEFNQVKVKLQKAEEQVKEFCSEDSSREEIIQELQSKLSSMTVMMMDEKNCMEMEIMRLKELLKSLEAKDIDSSNDIENLQQNIEISEQTAELQSAKDKLQMEKSKLKEQLTEAKSELDIILGANILLRNEIDSLTADNILFRKEKLAQQQTLDNLREELKKLKDLKDLNVQNSKAMEYKEAISNLQTNYQRAQEENQKLQKELKELKDLNADDVLNSKENQRVLLEENRKLQTELEGTKKSLIELQKDQVNIQDKLKHYQRLQEDKVNLELTLNKLQKEQYEALSILEHEKHMLQETLKQCEEKNHELKEKEATLKLKIESLQTNYQRAQEENQKLQKELKELKDLNADDVLNSKENQRVLLEENRKLQTELDGTKKSLIELQKDQVNMQDKLKHYQRLQEDKVNLELALNKLQKEQYEALSILEHEKHMLQETLKQCEEKNHELKEKEATLKLKIESFRKQIHEMRNKVQSYDKLLLELRSLENVVSSKKTSIGNLQQEITELTSQQSSHISQIENLSSEIETFKVKLHKESEEKQKFEMELVDLKEVIKKEQSALQKESVDLKTSLQELKLKCDSLQFTNDKFKSLNQELQQELKSANEKLKEFNSMQDELKTVRARYSQLEESFKKADQCSKTLREDIEHHKHLLQEQLTHYNSMKSELETKLCCLRQENLKLTNTIETLKKETVTLEGKIREITVRQFEQDLQRHAVGGSENTSTESEKSLSPRARRSLERMNANKVTNTSLEERLKAERRNRRLSTQDERRQSYWGTTNDKETMTSSLDPNCNCLELDRKLKECERNLFIRTSQVTALSMEMKNHPLKEENSILKKRLKEEQDKHSNEIKRCKNKLYQQVAKAERAMADAAEATAKLKVANDNAALAAKAEAIPLAFAKVGTEVETQTDGDISDCIAKLQSKYNDLKIICRARYTTIEELEKKLSQKENLNGNATPMLDTSQSKTLLHKQCETLQRELKEVNEKYEYAKKLLHLRRREIEKLSSQMAQTQ